MQQSRTFAATAHVKRGVDHDTKSLSYQAGTKSATLKPSRKA